MMKLLPLVSLTGFVFGISACNTMERGDVQAGEQSRPALSVPRSA